MSHLNTCAATRTLLPLKPADPLPIGAHLVTPWLGFLHHGIYVGDGRVVHYGALMYDIIRKPVEEVTLETFAGGRELYLVRHAERCFDTAEILRRARSRLGEKRYRLLSNNCEHFVEWCLHGVHRSFQVNTALAYPRLVGERIQAAIVRFARRALAFRRASLATRSAVAGPAPVSARERPRPRAPAA